MQKNEVLDFLVKIDSYLEKNFASELVSKKFPLRIIGKGALLLAGMKDPIGTVDLDSLEIENKSSSPMLKTVATNLLTAFGRKQQIVHGYYLEFVGEAMVFLPRRTEWITLPGEW